MVRGDKWKKRPSVLKYRAFADECRLKRVKLANEGDHVVFTLPMPKSWPKYKKRALDGKPCQQTPDVDNLAKALMDALMKDDSGVYDVRITKKWGYEGTIEIKRIKTG